MEEIRKESIQVYTVYKAIDGTEFDDKKECETYEKTAKCVIWQKFWKLVINDTYNEWSLFNLGAEDAELFLVKMNNLEDEQTVLQAYYIDHSWTIENDDYENQREEVYDIVDKAYRESDILILSLDSDRRLVVSTTRNTIIENLNNIDKQEKTLN